MKTVLMVVGILLVVVAVVYFVEPANSLPSFFPGHDAALDRVHYKHGIAALVVGIALLGYGWFQSGK